MEPPSGVLNIQRPLRDLSARRLSLSSARVGLTYDDECWNALPSLEGAVHRDLGMHRAVSVQPIQLPRYQFLPLDHTKDA